jgi:hypothetical protein
MEKDQHHHSTPTPMVDSSKDPAHKDILHDVIDGLVGMIGRGTVIGSQQNSGHCLYNKK